MSVKTATPNVRKRAAVKYTKRPYATRRRRNAIENGWEFLITQCIVCGIILSVALIICLIKTPFTTSLRLDIKKALASNIYEDNSPESFAAMASSLNDSIRSLLIKSPPNEPAAEDSESREEAAPVFATDENFRIDEEILNSIYAENQANYGDEIKNQSAPAD